MAKKLESDLGKLSNSLLANLGDEIISYVERHDAVEVKRDFVYTKFVEVHAEYTEACRRRRRSGMGKVIKEANALRHARYGALKKGLQSMALSGDARAGVAKKLLPVLKRTEVSYLGYASKTGQYNVLISRLSTEPNASMLDEVGLRHLLNDLDAANKSFEDLRRQKSSFEAQTQSTPSATSFKPTYVEALRNLIMLAYVLRDVPVWDDFNAGIRQRINSTKISARGRKRRKKSEIEAEEKAAAEKAAAAQESAEKDSPENKSSVSESPVNASLDNKSPIKESADNTFPENKSSEKEFLEKQSPPPKEWDDNAFPDEKTPADEKGVANPEALDADTHNRSD